LVMLNRYRLGVKVVDRPKISFFNPHLLVGIHVCHHSYEVSPPIPTVSESIKQQPFWCV
jgi:hypothetical protein